MQPESLRRPSNVHMCTRDHQINLMIAVECLHIGGAEVVILRIAQTVDQRLFLIGVTATMIERKRLFEYLKVAWRFRDEGDCVRFGVVGEGPLRLQFNAARRELDLEETVAFTGWVEHASEIAVPAFDVFFQPFLWEAMSIALLEAMAAGKPVVASRVGEASYTIAGGQDGLLVDPGDIDGMPTALPRLVAAPGPRELIGRSGVRKGYSAVHGATDDAGVRGNKSALM